MGYPPQGYPVAPVAGRGRTIVVAASNSLDPTLAPPDYRCDGTDDQVEINAAITALGAIGGSVMLLEGTFAITAPVTLASNVALVGQGAGTVLRVPNGHDASLNVVSGSGIDHVLVANLRVDGNRANQAAGAMYGIRFDTVTHSKVVDCWVEDMYGGNGIRLYDSSNYNTVEGNTCQGNSGYGICIHGASYNTVAGNTCQGNGAGIDLDSSSSNTVTGNNCSSNTAQGIYINSTSNNNRIGGNIVAGNSQGADSTYDGICIETDSDYNLIQGNVVRHLGLANQHRNGIGILTATCDGNLVLGNDLYQAGRTNDYYNGGTGTVYHNNRATVGWVP